MTKPKLSSLLIVLFSCSLLSACGPSQKSSPSVDSDNPSPTNSTLTIIPSIQNMNDTVVTLKTKSGPIALKLYSKEAPKTVANFLKKVNSGFYNNLSFHRVEPGFVVQGGDPQGNGTGGGKISSEINTIAFRRGSLGLARGPIKSESNDSQFFICLSSDTCSHLTNEYVNFGEVISGMEFVDQIKVGDKIVEITPYTK